MAGSGRTEPFSQTLVAFEVVPHEGIQVSIAVQIAQPHIPAFHNPQALAAVEEISGPVIQPDFIGIRITSGGCAEGIQIAVAVQIAQASRGAVGIPQALAAVRKKPGPVIQPDLVGAGGWSIPNCQEGVQVTVQVYIPQCNFHGLGGFQALAGIGKDPGAIIQEDPGSIP